MISVIIPVYNTEKFVTEAVQSAIVLPEVSEIILVEDGSRDHSLKICEILETEYEKVKLFTHEGNRNKGAGASRNLGIRESSSDYIAFLDADDKYLENRFVKDIIILKDKSIDGVYSKIGAFNENGGNRLKRPETGISKEIEPHELFEEMLTNSEGINTLGVTLRKEVLNKIMGFNEKLGLHQDTELWLRLAFHYRLVGANLDHVVALRREHPKNRIKNKNSFSKLMFNSVLLNYYSGQNMKKSLLIYIILKHFDSVYKSLRILPFNTKLKAFWIFVRDFRFYVIALLK